MGGQYGHAYRCRHMYRYWLDKSHQWWRKWADSSFIWSLVSLRASDGVAHSGKNTIPNEWMNDYHPPYMNSYVSGYGQFDNCWPNTMLWGMKLKYQRTIYTYIISIQLEYDSLPQFTFAMQSMSNKIGTWVWFAFILGGCILVINELIPYIYAQWTRFVSLTLGQSYD